MAGPRALSALRERRRQAGLTQGELAARAGVSRQLIAAVEAGQNSPAVDTALRLAQVLVTTVEELFGAMPAPVLPAIGDSLDGGVPLRVGRVGDQLVAAELPEHGAAGAAWASPDGVCEQGQLRLFPGANPAGVVLAGCDPALGIAEAALRGLGPSSLLAISASTGTALRSLVAGRLHGAVIHGPEALLPPPPVPVLRLHLARWQVGIGTASGHTAASLEELLDADVPIVQRDGAAASQQALERALAGAARASARGPTASGHIDAARTAAILNCAALTTEGAARAFGLRFQPLEEHIVQIWINATWARSTGVIALANLLTLTAFTDRVAQFGGYDLTGCGTLIEGG